MNKYILILILCVASVACNAQQRKFDAGKYEQDLTAFVIKEAKLTKQESDAFTPIFKDMRQKMHKLFTTSKFNGKQFVNNEKAAMNAIKNFDAKEIEMKKLQQTYHNKLLKIMPATKVMLCIMAEENFNQIMMRKAVSDNFMNKGKFKGYKPRK